MSQIHLHLDNTTKSSPHSLHVKDNKVNQFTHESIGTFTSHTRLARFDFRTMALHPSLPLPLPFPIHESSSPTYRPSNNNRWYARISNNDNLNRSIARITTAAITNIDRQNIYEAVLEREWYSPDRRRRYGCFLLTIVHSHLPSSWLCFVIVSSIFLLNSGYFCDENDYYFKPPFLFLFFFLSLVLSFFCSIAKSHTGVQLADFHTSYASYETILPYRDWILNF